MKVSMTPPLHVESFNLGVEACGHLYSDAIIQMLSGNKWDAYEIYDRLRRCHNRDKCGNGSCLGRIESLASQLSGFPLVGQHNAYADLFDFR
ncbi:protein of unknown function [Magnetospira sp. QH-2]|nr:protein of unknown function [Magnetospira sp. QH-2]